MTMQTKYLERFMAHSRIYMNMTGKHDTQPTLREVDIISSQLQLQRSGENRVFRFDNDAADPCEGGSAVLTAAA